MIKTLSVCWRGLRKFSKQTYEMSSRKIEGVQQKIGKIVEKVEKTQLFRFCFKIIFLVQKVEKHNFSDFCFKIIFFVSRKKLSQLRDWFRKWIQKKQKLNQLSRKMRVNKLYKNDEKIAESKWVWTAFAH